MTYDEMEYICFRVFKLEDMIKGNVTMDDLAKLENKMASKEDLKGMARKEYLKKLNEIMKDIKIDLFSIQLLLKKVIRRKMGTYSSHVLRKLKNNWTVRSLSPQKLMIHYKSIVSTRLQGTTLLPKLA